MVVSGISRSGAHTGGCTTPRSQAAAVAAACAVKKNYNFFWSKAKKHFFKGNLSLFNRGVFGPEF